MTLRQPGFWIYVICLAATGLGMIGFILATQYHPSFDVRNTFVVLDTDTTSISLQWPGGAVSVWIATKNFELRVWPP